ncbi:MAG TPA: DNA polymerase III subunit beta [Anaerolineaceae bacterium]|jgi:DNA polymerase-3 subunit beta|nr:DNA polymerase III subunit beta [Anaerolineaceae bacterium]HOR83973.1 DNA polymerase III subunit beta [Anaerolineaceae bacterium]HPL42309.1 DNA polymerase III subunit beta [Anaerolineaceae bacterium]HPY33203.1 DNA polymerase III subunit beta [Anaerolineaceae bacterium]HQC21101.1 DNA polymerase III subunit beta [Anaerolineaceae bacterium]
MKAIVKQQQLAQAVGIVARAVASRSPLPVLANILIQTDNGRLKLSATNLELGISAWLGAKIQEEGGLTVPSRTFADLVSSLPSDEVTLTADLRTQSLNVRCGTLNTDIKGINAEEFPPMSTADSGTSLPLNVANFKDMIQKVVFAASTDDSRPNLTGVHMTTDGDYLVLAATDGYRISIASAILSPKPAQKLDALIPARALSELSRIAVDGDETLEMNFPVGRGQVVFHLKDAELISQLIEGNFPNYTAIIPPSFKTHTVLTTADLLKACRQTEIIAREGNFIARLDIQPEGSTEKPPQLEISAISEQTGSSEVIVDASVDGTPLLISFNVRFLREVLEVIRTPNVLLETNAANTPAMIRPVGDDTFKHIIMPMNIQR